jgi:alpha-1,2-mannosyltransferase
MGAFLDTLRTGHWLTRERMQLWGLAVLAASALGFIFLVVTSDGLNDYQGRPLGTDFANVYAAGTYAIEGRAAAPFDWPAQHAREQAIFGDNTPFYGWHYPPFFLFVAGLLALMPYALALAVWQGATLALYLGTIWIVLRGVAASAGAWPNLLTRDPLWLMLALAFPAVFVNIGHGHNGFLTAALLGAALIALDRRPMLAGILFGLIAYKPQFGVLIPLVLIATGRWRALIAAGVTVAVLALATLIAFGPEPWRAFFASAHLTRVEVLEQGGTGWHKIQSAFSMVRMWGGGVPLAYAAQGAVTVALATALTWLWRSAAAYPLKAGALIIGAILATPYSLDYDFVVLAPAIAFLAADGFARGFGPYEKTALALLWFMPLIARTVAEHTLVPLGVPAMLFVLILALRQAADDIGLPARWHSAAQPIK